MWKQFSTGGLDRKEVVHRMCQFCFVTVVIKKQEATVRSKLPIKKKTTEDREEVNLFVLMPVSHHVFLSLRYPE